MLTNYRQILGLGLVLLYLLAQTDGVCNVCQTNQVACINSTSFYLCFGDGTPHTNQLYHCLDGFDCTNLTAICAQKSSQRPPSCGDTAQCGLCSAQRNYLFACLSRSIFQMCYGANWPSGSYGYCPTGYVCDATSDTVCIPEVAGQSYTCDINDDLVDTTTTTTTTTTSTTTTSEIDISTDDNMNSTETASTTEDTNSSTTNPWTALEVCEEQRKTGLYTTVPVDVYCQRYIYCYYKNGVVKAAEYNCTANTYFNAENQVCSYIKPNECL